MGWKAGEWKEKLSKREIRREGEVEAVGENSIWAGGWDKERVWGCWRKSQKVEHSHLRESWVAKIESSEVINWTLT